MIKILRNKFLICMFLLVVSVIITSSCYAMTVESADNLSFTVEDIYSNVDLIERFNSKCGYVPTIDNTTLVVYYANNRYYTCVIDGKDYGYITPYSGSSNYNYSKLYYEDGSSAKPYRVVYTGSSLSYYVDGVLPTFVMVIVICDLCG